MPETNADLARRGYQAVLRGDLEAVNEFLDEDVKWHGGDPTAAGACTNRAQALEWIRRAVENRRVGELVDVHEAGDRVAVIMRPPASPGDEPRLTANVTTFRNGKAVEIVHYPNPEDALAAIGPTP